MRVSLLLLLTVVLSVSGCDYLDEGFDPRIQVMSVVLNEAPLMRPDGSSWDDDGPADVVVEIQTLGGVPISESQLYDDLASIPDEGISLNVAFEVGSGNSIAVAIFDRDPTTLELMGVTEVVSFDELAGYGSGTFLLTSTDGSTQATLTFQLEEE